MASLHRIFFKLEREDEMDFWSLTREKILPKIF